MHINQRNSHAASQPTIDMSGIKIVVQNGQQSQIINNLLTKPSQVFNQPHQGDRASTMQDRSIHIRDENLLMNSQLSNVSVFQTQNNTRSGFQENTFGATNSAKFGGSSSAQQDLQNTLNMGLNGFVSNSKNQVQSQFIDMPPNGYNGAANNYISAVFEQNNCRSQFIPISPSESQIPEESGINYQPQQTFIQPAARLSSMDTGNISNRQNPNYSSFIVNQNSQITHAPQQQYQPQHQQLAKNQNSQQKPQMSQTQIVNFSNNNFPKNIVPNQFSDVKQQDRTFQPIRNLNTTSKSLEPLNRSNIQTLQSSRNSVSGMGLQSGHKLIMKSNGINTHQGSGANPAFANQNQTKPISQQQMQIAQILSPSAMSSASNSTSILRFNTGNLPQQNLSTNRSEHQPHIIQEPPQIDVHNISRLDTAQTQMVINNDQQRDTQNTSMNDGKNLRSSSASLNAMRITSKPNIANRISFHGPAQHNQSVNEINSQRNPTNRSLSIERSSSAGPTSGFLAFQSQTTQNHLNSNKKFEFKNIQNANKVVTSEVQIDAPPATNGTQSDSQISTFLHHSNLSVGVDRNFHFNGINKSQGISIHQANQKQGLGPQQNANLQPQNQQNNQNMNPSQHPQNPHPHNQNQPHIQSQQTQFHQNSQPQYNNNNNQNNQQYNIQRQNNQLQHQLTHHQQLVAQQQPQPYSSHPTTQRINEQQGYQKDMSDPNSVFQLLQIGSTITPNTIEEQNGAIENKKPSIVEGLQKQYEYQPLERQETSVDQMSHLRSQSFTPSMPNQPLSARKTEIPVSQNNQAYVVNFNQPSGFPNNFMQNVPAHIQTHIPVQNNQQPITFQYQYQPQQLLNGMDRNQQQSNQNTFDLQTAVLHSNLQSLNQTCTTNDISKPPTKREDLQNLNFSLNHINPNSTTSGKVMGNPFSHNNIPITNRSDRSNYHQINHQNSGPVAPPFIKEPNFEIQQPLFSSNMLSQRDNQQSFGNITNRVPLIREVETDDIIQIQKVIENNKSTESGLLNNESQKSLLRDNGGKPIVRAKNLSIHKLPDNFQEMSSENNAVTEAQMPRSTSLVSIPITMRIVENTNQIQNLNFEFESGDLRIHEPSTFYGRSFISKMNSMKNSINNSEIAKNPFSLITGLSGKNVQLGEDQIVMQEKQKHEISRNSSNANMGTRSDSYKNLNNILNTLVSNEQKQMQKRNQKSRERENLNSNSLLSNGEYQKNQPNQEQNYTVNPEVLQILQSVKQNRQQQKTDTFQQISTSTSVDQPFFMQNHFEVLPEKSSQIFSATASFNLGVEIKTSPLKYKDSKLNTKDNLENFNSNVFPQYNTMGNFYKTDHFVNNYPQNSLNDIARSLGDDTQTISNSQINNAFIGSNFRNSSLTKKTQKTENFLPVTTTFNTLESCENRNQAEKEEKIILTDLETERNKVKMRNLQNQRENQKSISTVPPAQSEMVTYNLNDSLEKIISQTCQLPITCPTTTSSSNNYSNNEFEAYPGIYPKDSFVPLQQNSINPDKQTKNDMFSVNSNLKTEFSSFHSKFESNPKTDRNNPCDFQTDQSCVEKAFCSKRMSLDISQNPFEQHQFENQVAQNQSIEGEIQVRRLTDQICQRVMETIRESNKKKQVHRRMESNEESIQKVEESSQHDSPNLLPDKFGWKNSIHTQNNTQDSEDSHSNQFHVPFYNHNAQNEAQDNQSKNQNNFSSFSTIQNNQNHQINSKPDNKSSNNHNNSNTISFFEKQNIRSESSMVTHTAHPPKTERISVGLSPIKTLEVLTAQNHSQTEQSSVSQNMKTWGGDQQISSQESEIFMNLLKTHQEFIPIYQNANAPDREFLNTRDFANKEFQSPEAQPAKCRKIDLSPISISSETPNLFENWKSPKLKEIQDSLKIHDSDTKSTKMALNFTQKDHSEKGNQNNDMDNQQSKRNLSSEKQHFIQQKFDQNYAEEDSFLQRIVPSSHLVASSSKKQRQSNNIFDENSNNQQYYKSKQSFNENMENNPKSTQNQLTASQSKNLVERLYDNGLKSLSIKEKQREEKRQKEELESKKMANMFHQKKNGFHHDQEQHYQNYLSERQNVNVYQTCFYGDENEHQHNNQQPLQNSGKQRPHPQQENQQTQYAPSQPTSSVSSNVPFKDSTNQLAERRNQLQQEKRHSSQKNYQAPPQHQEPKKKNNDNQFEKFLQSYNQEFLDGVMQQNRELIAPSDRIYQVGMNQLYSRSNKDREVYQEQYQVYDFLNENNI